MNIPLVYKYNIPHRYHPTLTSLEFMINKIWNFPRHMQLVFPDLLNYISNCHIALEDIEDKIVWSGSNNGILSLNQDYDFIDKPNSCDLWNMFSWNPSIPPSKDLLVWKIMYNRLSSDENLTKKGFVFPKCVLFVIVILKILIICSLTVNLLKSIGIRLVSASTGGLQLLSFMLSGMLEIRILSLVIIISKNNYFHTN